MATFSNQGSFNQGIQRSITLIDNTGAPVPYGGDLISFTSKPDVVKVKIKPIDNGGYQKNEYNYEGWSGSFTVARNNGQLDQLQAAQEVAFHNGQGQIYYTIDEVTLNNGAPTNVYQYIGCAINMESAGDWKMDSAVDITVSFEAQARVQIA